MASSQKEAQVFEACQPDGVFQNQKECRKRDETVRCQIVGRQARPGEHVTGRHIVLGEHGGKGRERRGTLHRGGFFCCHLSSKVDHFAWLDAIDTQKG